MADRVVQDGIHIRELRGRSGSEGDGKNDSADRVFYCEGSADPFRCRTALLAQSFYNVFNFDGLVLKTLAYDGYADKPDAWEFSCNYANVPEVGGYTVSIDTGGGQVKTTSAYAQSVYPAPGQSPPNFGTSIDVQDKKAQGVDTVIPALKLDIVAKIDRNTIIDPLQYARNLAAITGRVNSNTYLGFAPGELLFMGASGDVITSGDPTLTFTYAASQNLSGYSIGPISGINKNGHDYIWFRFIPSKDGSANVETQNVEAAYVAVVYGSVPFTATNIGVLADADTATQATAARHARQMLRDQRRAHRATVQAAADAAVTDDMVRLHMSKIIQTTPGGFNPSNN